MAGDWIKIEHNLHKKPEVFAISRKLGICPDEVVGFLVRFWVWADINSVDGHVDHIQSTDVDAVVDAVVDRENFSAALRGVNWLVIDPSGVGFYIPNFDRHNGESAKKRVLKTQAQARWRKGLADSEEQKPNAKTGRDNVDHQQSTSASTREEKRREESDSLRSKKEVKQVEVVSENQKPPTELKESTSAKRKTQFPFGEEIPDDMKAEAQKRVPHANAQALYEKFRLYNLSKGNTYIDWSAAWRVWLMNAPKFGDGLPMKNSVEAQQEKIRASKVLLNSALADAMGSRIDDQSKRNTEIAARSQEALDGAFTRVSEALVEPERGLETIPDISQSPLWGDDNEPF